MDVWIGMMLEAGKTGVNLSLYVILPIMVIMMAVMKVLDEKGVLLAMAGVFTPVLVIFGLPGIGVLAVIQILFISFAAPVAILKVMDGNPHISDARIAATFAAVLVMAQANASFPLAAVGLHLPLNILTSVVFGLLASSIAFSLCKKMGLDQEGSSEAPLLPNLENASQKSGASIITLLFKGGEEGLQIVFKSIPALVIAVFLVQVLTLIGAVQILERVMTPILLQVGIPGIAVLPMVTKFIAGGTAMMAILLDLMNTGALSVAELNRVAGFTLHPLDPVGLAVFMAAGPRIVKVLRPAVVAAIAGIVMRGIAHLVIF